MNIQELQKEIEKLGIPSHYYSINGSISADIYVLNKVYNYWEFFYIDERGGQNNYRRFDNENDACIYMLEALKVELIYPAGL